MSEYFPKSKSLGANTKLDIDKLENEPINLSNLKGKSR